MTTQTQKQRIQINGKEEWVEAGLSLKNLLLQRDVNPNVVACELNLNVIRRKNLDETILKEGDVLEIIQMVGGG